MRPVPLGNGYYEVHDNAVKHTVYVLDNGSCTCAIFQNRLAKWKANPDPVKEARVWCLHLEAAARHYNDNLRHPKPVSSYQEEAWRNAGRDLQRMLDDMTGEDT